MIVYTVREQRARKEAREGRKLTYEVIAEATGLSRTTLVRVFQLGDPVERIEGQTLSTLCAYFECGVGDLLEYVPDAPTATPASHSSAVAPERELAGVG